MKEQLRTGINRLAIAVSLIPAGLIWLGIDGMIESYPNPRWFEGSDDVVVVGLIGLAAVWIVRWVVLGFIPR